MPTFPEILRDNSEKLFLRNDTSPLRLFPQIPWLFPFTPLLPCSFPFNKPCVKNKIWQLYQNAVLLSIFRVSCLSTFSYMVQRLCWLSCGSGQCVLRIVDLFPLHLPQLAFLWQGCILFKVFKMTHANLVIQAPSLNTSSSYVLNSWKE